ncbi:hypothetical protein Ga0074812_14740 [Parafrankia irregularis]|uniref:Transcriptional regulator n=1 Tax=Parafrankia irregularis TaxID=795642 RepID=A0A0S4R1Z9_9ACTN|nr:MULTISPECIES: transcriptional regulator [Parafrankia]MBE3206647.1 transcriptional regulator [Parafrankia sp. CH37]CUU60794.1 hypothetical protein Ga0074812_14740 [Parafrankia irregularis]
MDADGVEVLKEALATRFIELQEAHGLSGIQLELRTMHDKNNVYAIRNRGRLPTREVLQSYDREFGTGTELTDLGERVRAAQKARRAANAANAANAAISRTRPAPVDEEVSGTNRRTFFEFGATSVLAVEAYRRHAGNSLDPLTLEELDDELADYAERFTTTPHDQLAPEIAKTWRHAETLLEAGPRPRAQAQLTRVAAFSAYYLGRLAFNTGNRTASRRFIHLAAEHAQEIDDPVLTGSVFEMLSTLAFYGHQYKKAANFARRGFTASGADPYVAGRLASYEVRAHVALGDESAARAALTLMTKHVSVSPPIPGASPFGPTHADQTTARTLALLGDGHAAEPLARASVEAYERTGGGFEDRGNAALNLSWALLLRPHPEPEAAAVLAQQVLSAVDMTPTFSVLNKIVDVDRRLDRYAQLPAVRSLRAQLAERPRPAITQ